VELKNEKGRLDAAKLERAEPSGETNWRVFESRSTRPDPGITNVAAIGFGASMYVPARWHPSLSKATCVPAANVMAEDVN
jgi:hypothetical protein